MRHCQYLVAIMSVLTLLLTACGESKIKTSEADNARVKQNHDALAKTKRQSSPRFMMQLSAMNLYDRELIQAEEHRENYKNFSDSDIFKVSQNPVSTFSIDVDTGSYANVRRLLNEGRMPNKNAVRAEELINYFRYDYPYPKNKSQPFTINTEIGPTPWNKNSYLLHIGLQAYQSHQKERPANNLVFLVDVSGSMNNQVKLPLLKSGLKLLVKNLQKQDRISVVTYAGSTGVVLESVAGDKHGEITMALENLEAAGSTNGAGGIQLAYLMAQQSFIKGGVNRIILATDGDFNLGVTNFNDLKQMVEENRKTGITLTTLGFGRGNYNDHLMEQLADAGNGNHFYIDSLNEARKVLVEEMSSTLNTVANDVKIQIEFNPQQVSEYRLIGYENRTLKQTDFNNDKVDAGDIGENHTVTALYEITFADSAVKQHEKNRYEQTVEKNKEVEYGNELAFLKLRYKQNIQAESQLLEKPLYRADVVESLQQASSDFKFSAAVAAFAQQLRGGTYLQKFDYDDIIALAKNAKGDDELGYRGEFIQLVDLARSLSQ